MTRSLFAVIVLVFIALPSATAAVAAATPLQAAGLAADGTLTTVGGLRVAQVHNSAEQGSLVEVHLTADHLRIEVDERYRNLTVAGSNVNPGYDVRVYEYDGATLTGLSDDFFKLFFTSLDGGPEPTITWNSTGGTLAPSGQDQVDQFQYDDDRQPRQVAVADSMEWRSEGIDAQFSASGDLYFSVRQMPFEASGDGSTPMAFTGDDEGTSTGSVVFQDQVKRTAHIFATGARLEVRVQGADITHAVYMDADEVATDDPATLTGLTGSYLLDGAQHDAAGETVRFEDPIRLLDLQVLSKDMFRFSFPEPIEAALVGNTAGGIVPPMDSVSDPSIVVSAPSPSSSLPWWPLFVLVPLLSALYMARRPPFSVVRLAMEWRRYGFVSRTAPRFVAHGKRPGQAGLLYSVAMLKRGRHDEAGRFLVGLPEGKRPERPTWAYLMATVRSLQGQDRDALEHLQECLRMAPQYLDEVVGNPVFERFLNDPRLLAAFQDRPGSGEGAYA